MRKIFEYNTELLVGQDAGLVVSIGDGELACIVINEASEKVDAMEVFAFDKDDTDWHEAFESIRSSSHLIGKTYARISHYYTCPEAMIVPKDKFTDGAAADYLALVHGDNRLNYIHHDDLNGHELVTAYRIAKTLQDTLSRQHSTAQVQHVFSPLLKKLLQREALPAHFFKVQLYRRQMILAYLKEGKLQLIRAGCYAVMEDILYAIAGIIQQFHIPEREAVVELSGVLPDGNQLAELLKRIVAAVRFDEVTEEQFLAASADHPAYYFSPFYNLAL